MLITRRKLLESSGMLAALATIPAALQFEANAATAPARSNGAAGKTVASSFNKEMLSSLQGSNFQVTAKGVTPQWLTLVSVDDLDAPQPANTAAFAVQAPARNRVAPRTASFSARFYGGLTQLQQGTYTFENEKTGKFSLFIVPARSRFYLAIFNLLQ